MALWDIVLWHGLPNVLLSQPVLEEVNEYGRCHSIQLHLLRLEEIALPRDRAMFSKCR